jgi:hypothetical protein
MKKLMILMLVLGLAPFANAGIVLSVNGVTTSPNTNYTKVVTLSVNVTDTIGIYNDTVGDTIESRNFGAYLDFENPSVGNYILGTCTKGPAAGDFSVDDGFYTFDSGGNYTGGDFEELSFMQAWLPWTPEVAGTMINIPYTAAKVGTVYLTLWDSRVNFATTPVDTLIVYQIPEPMTIMMLGLGGLAIVRKRRLVNLRIIELVD